VSLTHRCTRAAAVLAIASIVLTGCAESVREGSSVSVSPASTPAPSAVISSPEAAVTPTRSEDSDYPRITGDYQADLAAAGYVPDDFDDATSWFEGHLCDDPIDMEDGSFFSSYQSTVESFATNPSAGPDLLRIVVEYKCPTRKDVLENILAGVDY
jgi:hypothetical protein